MSRCSLCRAHERARGKPTPCTLVSVTHAQGLTLLTPSQRCTQRTRAPGPALGLGGGSDPHNRSQPQSPPVCEQGGSHSPGQDFRGSGQSPVHFSTDRQGVQALGTAGGGHGQSAGTYTRWDRRRPCASSPGQAPPPSLTAACLWAPALPWAAGGSEQTRWARDSFQTDRPGRGARQSPRCGLSPSQPRIC